MGQVCEAVRIKEQITDQIQSMDEVLTKFEQSIGPTISEENQLKIKVEMNRS